MGACDGIANELIVANTRTPLPYLPWLDNGLSDACDRPLPTLKAGRVRYSALNGMAFS